jgi:hypothetical protein
MGDKNTELKESDSTVFVSKHRHVETLQLALLAHKVLGVKNKCLTHDGNAVLHRYAFYATYNVRNHKIFCGLEAQC